MKIVIVLLIIVGGGLFGYGYLTAHPELWDQLVAQSAQQPPTPPKGVGTFVSPTPVVPPEPAALAVLPEPAPPELAALKNIHLVDYAMTIWSDREGSDILVQHIFDIQCVQTTKTACVFKITYKGGQAHPKYAQMGRKYTFDSFGAEDLELRWFPVPYTWCGRVESILAVTFPRIPLPCGQVKDINIELSPSELRTLTGARQVALISRKWEKDLWGNWEMWKSEI